LVLVPFALTFYDIVFTHIATKHWGLVSFAKTPGPWLVKLYIYTWLAVGSFFVYDCSLNPYHENRRQHQLVSLVKPLTIGMGLQWHAQFMSNLIVGSAVGVLGYMRNIVAVSLVFFPVKSLGFGDFHTSGLSDHEKRMNGIVEEGGKEA
jgi:hypothetical protein